MLLCKPHKSQKQTNTHTAHASRMRVCVFRACALAESRAGLLAAKKNASCSANLNTSRVAESRSDFISDVDGDLRTLLNLLQWPQSDMCGQYTALLKSWMVSRQQCERQKCERHQCEARSANANSAKETTVRMRQKCEGQLCEGQECECDFSAIRQNSEMIQIVRLLLRTVRLLSWIHRLDPVRDHLLRSCKCRLSVELSPPKRLQRSPANLSSDF